MPNLRIIYDNAADRAVLTSSSQSGALGPANLQIERKSAILRSVGTSLTITATWPAPELGGAVVLLGNLSPTATIRVRGGTFDTGVVPACLYAPLGLWEWGALPLGVNAFSYGGMSYGRAWFDITSFAGLTIDLADPDNPAGYIELSRLVVGTYWSPENNASYGAGATPIDSTTQYRTESGEQRIQRGTLSRSLSIPLDMMTPMDRANAWRLARGAGLSKPIFASLFPENGDPELEQTHEVYGRLSSLSAITTPSVERYATTIQIEEI
jgi:hypothetical protein